MIKHLLNLLLKLKLFLSRNPERKPMQDFKISEHFSFFELTRTDNREFIEKNREEGKKHEENLVSLAYDLLEPVRTKWGALIVHSAYRCPELNKAVGSSDRSQHLIGQAADFHILGRLSGIPLQEVFNWIWHESGLKWHQLIDEFGWIHIASATGTNDMQVLRLDRDGLKIIS